MAMKEDKNLEKEVEAVVVATETPEQPIEEAEPNKAPVSRSRSFMMAKYPDESFDDEALYEEKLADLLEQNDKDLQAYRDADTQLEEVLDLNPELALVIGDLKRGVPFATALARYVDLESLAPIEGEPDYEEFEKSKAARKEELQKKNEHDELLRTNAEKSAEEITEYLEAKGWTPERRADFDSWFDDLVKRLSENVLGKKEMEIFIKGYEHDEAVKRAEENGRIAGRNEKIETKRKIQENVDDLPEGGSTSRVETTAPRQRKVIDIEKLLGK